MLVNVLMINDPLIHTPLLELAHFPPTHAIAPPHHCFPYIFLRYSKWFSKLVSTVPQKKGIVIPSRDKAVSCYAGTKKRADDVIPNLFSDHPGGAAWGGCGVRICYPLLHLWIIFCCLAWGRVQFFNNVGSSHSSLVSPSLEPSQLHLLCLPSVCTVNPAQGKENDIIYIQGTVGRMATGVCWVWNIYLQVGPVLTWMHGIDHLWVAHNHFEAIWFHC